MPPHEDKVWISREEYDRLKQAEVATPIYAPYISSSAGTQNDTLQVMRRQQSLVSALLGIGFVLALIIPGLGWLAATTVSIFIIFALTSLVQYNRTKHRLAQGNIVTPRSTTKLVVTIVACVLLAPVVAFGGILLFFIVLFSVNGGPGS